jgi:phage terminase small subunit
MAHHKLTLKQEKFWQGYSTNGGNASAAYRAAYSTSKMTEATINKEASQLLKHPLIASRLSETVQAAAEGAKLTVQRIIEEYMRVAFLDPAKLFDEAGNLLPIHSMEEGARRAIGGIDVVELGGNTGKEGDSIVSQIKKIKLLDKLSALNDLGRHMGIFVDKKEITGKDGAPLQQSGVLLVGAVMSEDDWERSAKANAGE